MQKNFMTLALVIAIPTVSGTLAIAQQVPAIESESIQSTYMPARFSSAPPKTYGPLPVLSPDTVKLTPKEQKAVSLSNQWINKPETPNLGENGTVNFVFGNSLPSVICAPLYACDVALQPGEQVSQVDVGDAPRWKVTPASSGSGENAVTHLVIKPSDVGLSTNVLVHTDRRTYNMRLISKKGSWMPIVAFTYPEDAQAQWTAFKEQRQQTTLQARTQVTDSPTVAHSNLNFNYRIHGEAPNWKPIRVYSDQNKTYIQFPQTARNTEIPALVLLGTGNQEQLVNYRMVEDRFVVDKIIDKAALVTGVGRHQQRVEIVREGS
jgi:P-type conjugative transfer protein TrbG